MATNGLYLMFERIATKLSNLNKKLDYYLNVTSQCIDVTHTITSDLSGVTIASHAVRLIGNDLNISIRLSVNSTAQTTIGTGNVTNRDLCTITINNFMNTDTPSSDDSINLGKISAISSTGAMSSGYSAGNACPASLHYYTTVTDSTVAITCRIDALYAKTSEFRFSGDIPVIRVKSTYDSV